MTKYAAINTFLWVDTTGSGSFSKVLGVQDIMLPKIKADLIDVTTQDETDFYHDFLSTLIDSGEASFTLVLDPNEATQNETSGGLKWMLDNRTQRNMRFEFSYTSPVTRMRFVGIVTGFSGDAKVKGNLAASVTIKAIKKTTLEVGTGSGM